MALARDPQGMGLSEPSALRTLQPQVWRIFGLSQSKATRFAHCMMEPRYLVGSHP
jgi:hypothetical protein